MKKYIAIFILISVSPLADAQLYQTKAGLITVSGVYKGNAAIVESRQLHMNINYERAEMVMHVVLPLLFAGNDSLNRILERMAGSELSFHGTFNSNHIHIKPHQKLQLQIAGTVTMNKFSRPFSYAVTLEHFPNGNISCVLSGNFNLNLLDFGIPTLPGENIIVVRFRELLLKKTND